MTFRTLFMKTLLLIIMLSFATVVTAADDLRGLLFSEADEALAAANKAKAIVLSPTNYEKGMEYYKDASQRLNDGQSIEKIKKDLTKSTEYLRRALKTSELAETTLDKSIQARNDAEKAQASKYAKDYWEDAEDRFELATKRLESGNVKKALQHANRAQKLYRSAELDAIKAFYLTEARQLIARAKKDDVDDYAPLTLAKAEALLKEAEKELNENRYDFDRPRSLARNARYEASHAIYIAKIIKPVDKNDKSIESLVLEFEKPITRIAGSLDIVAELDEPSDNSVNQAISQIKTLQKEAYELSARKTEIVSLETEIQQLEKRLGIQSQTLAIQEENRKRFERVERQFAEEEAIVMTQGSKILIRLVGLSFRTGQATIDPQYFSLLKKLEVILKEYPESTAVLEGHTDSFGSDEANLTLSQKRAESVRAYLLVNAEGRNADSIQSVGYGESRPIGNNETEEGRARNRRIDLVIKLQ